MQKEYSLLSRESSFSLKHDNNRHIGADFLAAGVLIAFGVLLVYSVQKGIHVPDESCYLTIVQRLTQGDRLVVDEWHLSQLSTLFHYLPFRLYCAVTGGTEGIILFFRYLYVGIKLCFFGLIYLSLRRYRYWAVLCAAVFTGYDSFAIIALNYYDIGCMSVLVVCMILFEKEKQSPFELILCGFVFSCTVIAEPPEAFLYFFYTVCVMIAQLKKSKKKKERFPQFSYLLNIRAWLLITSGVAFCAVMFLIMLFAGVDLKIFFENFMELFSDSEYNFNSLDRALRLGKVVQFAILYGPIPVFSWVMLFVLPFFREKCRKYKRVLFPICAAVSLLSLITVFFHGKYETEHAVILSRPIFIVHFGLVCYFFSEKKDQKNFTFLLIGCLFALLEDGVSEITVLNTSIVSAVPSVLLFEHIFAEIKNTSEPQRIKTWGTFSSIYIVVFLIGFIAVEGVNDVYFHTFNVMEDFNMHSTESLSQVLTSGPYRGIRTTPTIAACYQDAIGDIDQIKQNEETAFYVDGECPWYYLYADLPYGTYTAIYVADDSRTRTLRYWKLHPDKLPSCIYVPFFELSNYKKDPGLARNKIRSLNEFVDFEITKGKAGYILHVTGWKYFPDNQ